MEGTTPLPNQDDGFSDSGISTETFDSLSHYVVRVTPHGKFTFDELFDFVNVEPQICRFVISRETVPQEHFHLVLSTDVSVDLQSVRDIIRAFIVPFWATDGKCPKGFGNKQYNLQVSTDVQKALSYCIKLGDYRYDGWSNEYIELCAAESYDKKKPSNFKSEYLDLCLSFQESDMDIRDFMIRYSHLKAKYGQQVVFSQAYGYALSNLIRREPGTASEFVENFLYKQ